MPEAIPPLDRQTKDHLVVAEFREGQAPVIHLIPETNIETVAAMNGHVLASTPLISLRVALEISDLLRSSSATDADFHIAQSRMRRAFSTAMQEARCDGK